MIIDKEKLIFIHIPKNAGTSIENLFGGDNTGFHHDDINVIKEKFPEKYNTYRKFTVIRNPYDRMVSWYFYYNIPNLINHLSKFKDHNFDINLLNFTNWVKNPTVYNISFIDDPKYLKPQNEWIDETVEIIKFENLNEELNNFFNKKINLPNNNKSKHKHYLEYYNKDTLDFIYNKYKEDFEKYNYKKI